MDKKIKIDCKLCNGSGWVTQTDEEGNPIKNAVGMEMQKPCKCGKINLWFKKLNDKHLYQRFIKSKFQTFNDSNDELKKAKSIAINYTKDYKNKNLLITGKSGTGKTHLAYAILNEILKNEYTKDDFILPKIIFYNDLIKQIERAKNFNSKIDIEDITKDLQKPSILLIDDFFKIKINDDILSVLFEVINSRTYEENKSTIITTEKNIMDLYEVDNALISRLMEKAKYGQNQNYIINLQNSDNYRI